MYKFILHAIVFFAMMIFIGGCSTFYSSFNYYKDKGEVKFQTSKENVFIYKVENPKYNDKFSRCVMDAYTLETKILNSALIIEHISLYSDCSWNGLARSMYTYFIKKTIKSTSMELVDRIEINEYEFSIYKTDKNCILYLISIYGINDNTFIVDKNGDFYYSLLLNLNPNYKIEKFKNNCYIDFNKSLVDDTHLINGYFERERDD